MKPEVGALSKMSASFILTCFCFLQLQTFFSLYGSCQGVCVFKHLSVLICPLPMLQVAEVKIELVSPHLEQEASESPGEGGLRAVWADSSPSFHLHLAS